jgi:TetR/AcrR family transcriptional regulator, acrEF/envCD operon repressor
MARRPAEPGVDRRQQILEAALDVFAEQGFEGATTKEIAARADVTPGLIYFYFPNKEELFCAAFEHNAHLMLSALQFENAAADEPVEEMLRAAFLGFVEALDTPRSLSILRLMMRTAAYAEPSAEGAQSERPIERARCRIRNTVQRVAEAFAAYLDTQVARGAIRPVDTTLVAWIFLQGTIMTLMRRKNGDPTLAGLTREELVDRLVAVLAHGLLPC